MIAKNICLTISTILQRMPDYCVTNRTTLQIYCWSKELKLCFLSHLLHIATSVSPQIIQCTCLILHPSVVVGHAAPVFQPALLHSLGCNLNRNVSKEAPTEMTTLLATKMSNGLNFTVLILLCNLLNLFSYTL